MQQSHSAVLGSWTPRESSPPPPFRVSPGDGRDIDEFTMAFNGPYHNFLVPWLAGDYPINHVYAGGFRPQTLTPAGTFKAGKSVHFEVSHWPFEDPSFGVLISDAKGSFRLPYGDLRETGLAPGPVLFGSIARIPGILSGTILWDRTGTTPQFTFPYSPLFPPGTILYCEAVGFDSGVAPPALGAVTDIVPVTVE